MTENERISILRKELGITMDMFGKRVGVTRSAISNIENGNRNVTDQMRKSICREFHVEPLWLNTGEGEMFFEPEESIYDDIDRIMSGENEFHKSMIKVIATLNDEEVALFKRKMKEMLNDIG